MIQILKLLVLASAILLAVGFPANNQIIFDDVKSPDYCIPVQTKKCANKLAYRRRCQKSCGYKYITCADDPGFSCSASQCSIKGTNYNSRCLQTCGKCVCANIWADKWCRKKANCNNDEDKHKCQRTCQYFTCDDKADNCDVNLCYESNGDPDQKYMWKCRKTCDRCCSNTPFPTTTTTTTPIPVTTVVTTCNNTGMIPDCDIPPPHPPHGDAKANDPRIVGGNATTIGEYPFMAALHEYESFLCGGSIIDETHILTAAHCLSPDRCTSGECDVHVGMHFVSALVSQESEHEVIRVDIHPHYDGVTTEYDVAVLTVSPCIQYTEYVKPVCLARHPILPLRMTIMGWGASEEGGDSPDNLQDAVVWHIPSCLAYPPGAINHRVMFCAGTIAAGIDSCQGDSGGAIIGEVMMDSDVKSDRQRIIDDHYPWVQYGIVSWGYGCARPYLPGVYAKVYSFVDWIDMVVSGELVTRPTITTVEPVIVTVNSTGVMCNNTGFSCGISSMFSDRATERIFGAPPAYAGEYPFMASLLVNGAHRCSGTIISETVILTAAQCVVPACSTGICQIAVGSWILSDLDPPEVIHEVANITVHPDYNSYNYEYDVALVHVSPCIQFNPFVNAICLPQDYRLPEIFKIIGWGTPPHSSYHLNNAGPMCKGGGGCPPPPDSLRKAYVLRTRFSCISYNPLWIKESMFCAGLFGYAETCPGDIGAPAVLQDYDTMRYIQYGIASWGEPKEGGCTEPDSPRVFGKVSHFMDFISSQFP